MTSLLGDPHSDGVAVPKPERRAGRKHGHYGPGPVHREAVTFPNCWGVSAPQTRIQGLIPAQSWSLLSFNLYWHRNCFLKKKNHQNTRLMTRRENANRGSRCELGEPKPAGAPRAGRVRVCRDWGAAGEGKRARGPSRQAGLRHPHVEQRSQLCDQPAPLGRGAVPTLRSCRRLWGRSGHT